MVRSKAVKVAEGKMKKKRWIAGIMVAALCCAANPVSVSAEFAEHEKKENTEVTVGEEQETSLPELVEKTEPKEESAEKSILEETNLAEMSTEKEDPEVVSEEDPKQQEKNETSAGTAEIRAVFDKTSYESGETVTVTVILEGTTFDMAGFHLSYRPDELSVVSLTMGKNLYNTAGSSWPSGQIEVLATAAGSREMLPSTILGTICFQALKAGSPDLEFSAGSDLYLDGKSAVAFKKSDEIPVTVRVIKDSKEESDLASYKEKAKQELKNYGETFLKHSEGVKHEKLQECLQEGLDKIEAAGDKTAVDKMAAEAKQSLSRIAEQDFAAPKLEKLSDKEDLSTAAEMISPVFSAEQTTYYLHNNRPLNGMPRTFYAKTGKNTTVVFNGTALRVSGDGTFSFDVPFADDHNRNVLTLTDMQSGLTQTYSFFSFGTGVRSGVSDYKLLDAQGNESPESTGQWKSSGAVKEISTGEANVKLKMKVGIKANEVFRADLLDQKEQVVQSFTEAAGEKEKSVDLETDVLSLHEGTNTWFLKCYGTYWEYEDGKRVEKQGSYTFVFLITYVGEDADGSLSDAELAGLKISLEENGEKNYFEGLQIGTYTYEMTLPTEEFTTISSKQTIWAFPQTKEGQELEVSAQNDRTYRPSCVRKESGYYEIFDYDATGFDQKDTFTLKIKVTAKDKIHQQVYVINVTKPGKMNMRIPKVYQDREYIITPKQPERTVNMTMESIILTNEEGERLNTASCIQNGMLTMEIGDKTVLMLDELQPINGSNYVIRMLKSGRTPIYLSFQCNGKKIEETVYVDTNYSVDYIKTEMDEAKELLYQAQHGDRIYADGAAELLQAAKAQANTVYEKYRSMNRYYMDKQQKEEINQAVKEMNAANAKFRQSEIGRKITAFDPLDSHLLHQQAENDAKVSDLELPDKLSVTIAGKHVWVSGVTWKSKPIWQTEAEESCRYSFTPILPTGYVVVEGVTLPTIRVDRGEKKFVFPVSSSLPLAADVAVQRVPLGTPKSALKFPNLQTYVRADLGQGLIDIPTIWIDQDGYDGNRLGTYVFQSKLDPDADGFKVAGNVKRNTFRTITVIVYQSENSGDTPKPGENTGGDGSGSGIGTANGSGKESDAGENGNRTGGSGSSTVMPEASEALTDKEEKQTQMSEKAPGDGEGSDSQQSGEGNAGQGEGGSKIYSVIAATMKENPLLTAVCVLVLVLLLLFGVLLGIRRRKE